MSLRNPVTISPKNRLGNPPFRHGHSQKSDVKKVPQECRAHAIRASYGADVTNNTRCEMNTARTQLLPRCFTSVQLSGIQNLQYSKKNVFRYPAMPYKLTFNQRITTLLSNDCTKVFFRVIDVKWLVIFFTRPRLTQEYNYQRIQNNEPQEQHLQLPDWV